MNSGFNLKSLRRIGALLAALMLLSGLPSAAQAQQYPCGNGPGPGEVVVGQTLGGSGIAPILLCQYVSGDESEETEQEIRPVLAPMVPSYMAAD